MRSCGAPLDELSKYRVRPPIHANSLLGNEMVGARIRPESRREPRARRKTSVRLRPSYAREMVGATGFALSRGVSRAPDGRRRSDCDRATRGRWSGRQDSNLRPPAPKAGALPGCATPRLKSLRILLACESGCLDCARTRRKRRLCQNSPARTSLKNLNKTDKRTIRTCRRGANRLPRKQVREPPGQVTHGASRSVPRHVVVCPVCRWRFVGQGATTEPGRQSQGTRGVPPSCSPAVHGRISRL